METAILAVILVVALAVLARIVWRSVSASREGAGPASCAGCPFNSKCAMQDRQHMDECGDEENDR